MKTGAVVLAAGGSTRLGRPKQLLLYEGKTLVRRAAEAALTTRGPVIIVVGREAEEIALGLRGLPVTVLPNEKWERGIGSSIRTGIAVLPSVDAVMILGCDQPRVEADLLHQLLAKQSATGKTLVASAYSGTVGIPALFLRKHFPALLSLGDRKGAKSILGAQPNELATIDFPGGAIDIDTEEDWRALQARP